MYTLKRVSLRKIHSLSLGIRKETYPLKDTYPFPRTKKVIRNCQGKGYVSFKGYETPWKDKPLKDTPVSFDYPLYEKILIPSLYPFFVFFISKRYILFTTRET